MVGDVHRQVTPRDSFLGFPHLARGEGTGDGEARRVGSSCRGLAAVLCTSWICITDCCLSARDYRWLSGSVSQSVVECFIRANGLVRRVATRPASNRS